MIEIGQPAPDFSLPDQDGGVVTLSELRGAPVVLYFYPKDDTSGCTAEACAFRDARHEYEAVGAKVVGVSPDSVRSHRRFADRYHLPFTLLADTGHTVCELYGVWKEKSLYGRKYMGVERSTFVIDAQGTVVGIFRKVRVDGHSDEVLRSVREAVTQA